jgi:hypothetical protein
VPIRLASGGEAFYSPSITHPLVLAPLRKLESFGAEVEMYSEISVPRLGPA